MVFVLKIDISLTKNIMFYFVIGYDMIYGGELSGTLHWYFE